MFSIHALKRRGEFTLDVAIDVPAPGVVALFGRSGCGKTTLVNIIAGLLAADHACIAIDGVVLEDTRSRTRLPAERRRIGYVFQDARLFPHFTVLGNLRYGERRAPPVPRPPTGIPMRRRGFRCVVRGSDAAPPVGGSEASEAPTGADASPLDRGSDASPAGAVRITLDQVVSLLGLQALVSRRVHQLSGGERQRVALGRALLSQPRLLLLDEPLAALDAARREEVLPYLEKLRDELAIPMIYVSHQFDEVLRLATHVALLAQGRVLAQGAVEAVSLHPDLRAIVGPDAVGAVLSGFIEAVDQATGLAAVRVGGSVLHVALRGACTGAALRIQLLARDVILATSRPEGLSVRNVLTGTITRIAGDDADTDLVCVDIGGASVLARVTRAASTALGLRAGLAVWVLVKAVSLRAAQGSRLRPE